MKKMKTLLIAVLAVIATGVLFTNCTRNTPSAVAEKYFEAWINTDYDTMMALSIESEVDKIEKIKEAADGTDEEKLGIMEEIRKSEREYGEAVIDPKDENKASVVVTLTNPEAEEEASTLTIKLLKENDAWKVKNIDAK